MEQKLKGLCPYCFEENDVELVNVSETVKVRGKEYEVEGQYLKCTKCGDTFADSEIGKDPLDQAFRKYREEHGMLQPEEIKELRERLGLTQRQFASKVSCDAITIGRYELGALQTLEHDKILSTLKDI